MDPVPIYDHPIRSEFKPLELRIKLVIIIACFNNNNVSQIGLFTGQTRIQPTAIIPKCEGKPIAESQNHPFPVGLKSRVGRPPLKISTKV